MKQVKLPISTVLGLRQCLPLGKLLSSHLAGCHALFVRSRQSDSDVYWQPGQNLPGGSSTSLGVSNCAGIVHPGIDVHFDIAFLNDHCRKVLHGWDFKLFGTIEN